MMDGKVIVMTGATSGIGQIAAERLAGMGARLVIVARDRARGAAALARLEAPPPRGGGHAANSVHLRPNRGVGALAGETAPAPPRSAVRLTMAATLFARRAVTEDGLERTFALNHMAYFVLTAGLVGRLVASA